MANLGTLPVPFAPSAACSTEMASVYNADGAYFLQGRPLSYSPCMPQNYVPSRSYYYSATECPSGYTPACSNFVTVQTLTGTQVTCCPTQQHFTCQVNVDWPHESTLVCATNLPSTTWTLPSVTVLLPDSTYVTALSGTNGGINAYGVQLQYDPAISTQAPATSTSAPGLTTTTGPGPTGSPSAQGLSTGAVAGIGVGCAIAGLAIAAAATSLFFRRRRPPHRDSPPAVQEPFMAEQHTDKAHGDPPPSEPFYTDSYSEPQVQEIETRQPVQEIDTTLGQVPEMSG